MNVVENWIGEQISQHRLCPEVHQGDKQEQSTNGLMPVGFFSVTNLFWPAWWSGDEDGPAGGGACGESMSLASDSGFSVVAGVLLPVK